MSEYKINKSLAKQRGLNDYDILAIEKVGSHLHQFFARPTMYADPKDVSEIVASYEFVLQSLWGFPYDSSKHKYQLRLNGCTCKDLMDNSGYTGGPFWNATDCPYHSV